MLFIAPTQTCGAAALSSLHPAVRGPFSGFASQLGGHLHHFEGLDDVTLLDVLVTGETDAAVESLPDLAGIVLEAPQRRFKDDASEATSPS